MRRHALLVGCARHALKPYLGVAPQTDAAKALLAVDELSGPEPLGLDRDALISLVIGALEAEADAPALHGAEGAPA